MKRTFFSVLTAMLLGATMFFIACDKTEDKDPPLIQNVEVTGQNVGPFTVNATILDDNGDLKSADLYWKIGANGTFTTVAMTKGANNVYSAEIPEQQVNDTILYYIKAVNSVDLITLMPADAPATLEEYIVAGLSYTGLVINEIWAGAPTDNEKFIEILNTTSSALDISGIYFERNNDGTVGTVPAGTSLAAGAYYILGTKDNTINPNDPNAPYDNSISSGFSAKKSIRFRMLSPSGGQIDFFLRGDEANLDVTITDLSPKVYARIPNGTGVWKLVDNPTLRAANDPTGAIDIPNSK
jgi:hypothetical protein